MRTPPPTKSSGNGVDQVAEPAAEQLQDGQEGPSVEEELSRLTQLQKKHQQARLQSAQQEIAAICQRYRVQLVAQPQITPDGRIVAPVAITLIDQ